MKSNDSRSTQWLEIEAEALAHNLNLFRKRLSSETELLGVVKANAYGHGLAEVASSIHEDVDWLGVHSAAEARQLRTLGLNGRVLIMGFVPPSEFHDLDRNMHLLVSSTDALKMVGEYRQKSGISVPVHLKIDVGTKRQGVPPASIPLMAAVAAQYGLDIVGVASHFANIEDTIEHDFAKNQLDRFHAALEQTQSELGALPPYIHMSCSAAALLFRTTDFSVARVGISMYGHWPSRETRLSWKLEYESDGLLLQPALTWKTMVGQLQTVETDASVGYGRTWTAGRLSQLAVIPVGYADGYSRVLGNRSRVLIRGRSAPVVGRVCMNILMADVTDISGVSIGDEVVLIGNQEGDQISVEELASLSDTINYEFLARLSPAIPRLVV